MRWLDRLEEWIIAGMLTAMTVLTFVQVVLRYVFDTGFTWALELTGLFFAVMIFVGISYGIRVGAHIGVDAIVRLLSRGPRRIISIGVVLACLVYAGLVIFGSLEYVSKMKVVGVELEDLAIPVWMARSILPIGYALLTFRLLQVLWQLVTGKSESLHLADEVAEALKLKVEDEQP
jgi:C4-dicarboxylate transporter DctQ subunit